MTHSSSFTVQCTSASLRRIKASVVIDGAKLSFDDNVALTKDVVGYVHGSGRSVLVEGELGYIGTSSKLLAAVPEGVSEKNMTAPEEAKRFVEATDVDLFSPAVG